MDTGARPDARLIDGRFELLNRLGGGGMGLVWRARDIALQREVALKEVRPADPGLAEADPAAAAELRERVLREARALARLQHPNVAVIHHIVDSAAYPHPWLVMELVTGGSLGDLLERGPLPVADAARIGRGVLAALRAAHAAGIMHRDVKPGNVLLRADGTPGLTDFGIAAFSDATGLTATGSLVGSPEYIAPERIRGREGDPSSDLWSLGMLLYVAVEGSHPLRRGTALATLAAVLDEPLPPPSRAGRLGPLLTALLAKDPAARPDPDQVDRTLAQAMSAAAPAGAWPPAAGPTSEGGTRLLPGAPDGFADRGQAAPTDRIPGGFADLGGPAPAQPGATPFPTPPGGTPQPGATPFPGFGTPPSGGTPQPGATPFPTPPGGTPQPGATPFPGFGMPASGTAQPGVTPFPDFGTPASGTPQPGAAPFGAPPFDAPPLGTVRLGAGPVVPVRRWRVPALAAVCTVVLAAGGSLAWGLLGYGTHATGSGSVSGVVATGSSGPVVAPSGSPSTGTPPASTPGGSSGDGASGVDLLTPAGLRHALSVMRPLIPGGKVYNVTVYPTYALAEVPSPVSSAEYIEVDYRDGQATRGTGGPVIDEKPIDLAVYDWNVLPALLRKAQATLNIPHPDSRYLIIEPDLFDQTPVIAVYFSDGGGGSAYLTADPKGTVRRTDPLAP
ncbi:protein kinase [Streptacidiphilus sp. MAP12-33]|uniref:protein kinase domain-containing protein n=1 Tax=Streptacidiphilus sp. MAP12-33 TaxID=3156266 RepID=UPI003513FE04